MPIYEDRDEKEARSEKLSPYFDDNWDKLVETDHFLWVFDHLPKKMRLIVDFKIEGRTNDEIAKILNTTEKHIYNKLLMAKKRFIQAER